MTRWLATRLALLGAYAAYVSLQLRDPTEVHLVVASILLATIAGLLYAARDDLRARATLAAASLVLAALHARALPPDAAWLGLQLALAAAVAQSAAVSLAADRLRHRPGIVVVVGLLLVTTLVAAPAVAEHGARVLVPTIGFATLAALRPLGALGAILAAAGLNDGTRDPMLWWRPELAATTHAPPRAPAEARP